MEPLLISIVLAAAGMGVIALGLSRNRRPSLAVGEYLRDLDGPQAGHDAYDEQLAEPFFVRVVRPVSAGIADRVKRLLPRHYLETVHHKLLLGGLTASVRAEDFVVAQVAVTGLLTVGSIAFVLLGQPSVKVGVLLLILAPLVGILLPPAWLTRKVRERHDAILRDLPDTLDLLAISVEAGVGFEGALSIVCQHFDSPLATEFARTLREMELGLPRKEAFTNLKRRTEVPELSNLVLALLQADALGIPVARVLKTQATEMRNKRRQWAREKAGKLPVKMLFPLVVFVFPSILVVVLGPAAGSIMQALR